MHVLILGGTTEARLLAGLLDGVPGLRVTSSLAGRVASPRLPPGEVRVGGFGGVDGLTEWLRAHDVGMLIDATHPFARRISFHAAEAAARAHVPLLALRRPGWVRGQGDDWHAADSLEEAAGMLPALGRRVFLTTGRLGLAAFAPCDGLWFLVRSVDAPEGPRPPQTEILLDRGPFTLDGERELLARHRVDVLVTKDSGGAATAPKLTAAREAGIPVVVVRRPPVPEGVEVSPDPEDAALRVLALMDAPPLAFDAGRVTPEHDGVGAFFDRCDGGWFHAAPIETTPDDVASDGVAPDNAVRADADHGRGRGTTG